MSTTIDQRVVEMRFDNKQFENNVSTTMSTLDKLKQKLNFRDASKGLDSVSTAAKNVNMNGLGAGVDAVHAKFSALQVMGVTALANITNSAVNAGKRIVSALTIDPIRSGFQEYETQINAVQTILANTSSKGTTIDDVNKALEQLNEYADKTIYNFTEMTRNIGTFTAAGVDLDTSVSAIQGIANLAAVSGSTSQQASTAMYQLSQALATGTVKLQDWNSVVNAGMGGEVFQNALVRTAAAMDGAAENVEAWRAANIDSFGSFRDSLTQGGWLTTEVLTETLNQFTMAAEEGSKEWESYKKSLMDTGYTEKQAEEILKMANTATDAATKVKTFTQLWDVLKESAQSGWSQTWKLIIGDFEEAKALLTPLADFLTNMIGRFSDFRNKILENAMVSTVFEKFSDVFETVGSSVDRILKPVDKASEVVEGAISAVTDLGTIVDEVILGKFGNGEERFNALSEAGINFYEVQNKVNEKLGDSHRYTNEQIEAQNKLLGTQAKNTEAAGKQGEATKAATKAFSDLTQEQKDQLKTMGDMNLAQLQAAGYTDDQIAALMELKKVADDLGVPFEDFIDNLDQLNGRFLLFNGFKNIGMGLVDVGRAIGQAWKDVFPEHTVENFADKLFNLLSGFSKLTSAMTEVFYTKRKNEAGEVFYELTETGDKLVRTLKGVFAILDIIATITGGAFKIAFKVVTGILEKFDLNILDITAVIGDVIVKFRDWVDNILDVSGAVDFLVPLIKSAAKFIGNLVSAVKNSKWFAAFCEYLSTASKNLSDFFGSMGDLGEFTRLVTVLKNAGAAIKDWFENLKGSENIPRDIIAGLANGIREGAPEILSAMFDLGKAIIIGICEALEINSPSKEMETVGGHVIDGLVVGLQNGAKKIKDTIVGIGKSIIDWFKNLDFGAIFAVSVGASMIALTSKIGQALTTLAGPFEGLGDMFEDIGKGAKSFLKGLGSYFKANAWEARAKAMISFAIAIGILAAAVYVLSTIDTGKLWSCVLALGALATIIGVFSTVMSKSKSITGGGIGEFFGSLKESINFAGLGAALMGLSLVLLALTYVVKKIGELDPEQAKQGFLGLAGLIGGIAIVFAAYGTLVKGKSAQNVNKLGGMLLKLSIALLLMVTVTKLIGRLDEDEMLKGAAAMGAFVVFVGLLAAATQLANKQTKNLGGMLLKMSIALLLLVGVAKLAGTLTPEEMLKGAAAMGAFIIFVGALAAITRLVGKNSLEKVGSTLLAMSGSILILTIVGKMIAGMTWGDMGKALVGITGLGAVIAGLVFVTSKFGKDNDLKRVGTTLVMMSVAIGILAGVVALLGLLKIEHLAKGVIAVSILGLVMAEMVKATKGASACTGNIIAMTVAIGLMAAAVAALSMIDTGDLIIATGAMSLLMGMFALIVKTAGQAKIAMGGLIVMAGVIAILGGLLYLLAGLPIEGTIAAAASLSTLLLVLSVSLKILSTVKAVSPMAVVAVGAMVVIMGLLGGLLWLLKDLPVDTSIGVALSLSVLLLSMSVVLGILAAVGAVAPAALIGMGLLAILIAGIGLILKDIDEFLVGATDNLPTVADNLSSFMTKLDPFISGISGLDESFGSKITALTDGIATLAKAELLSTITSWLPGSDDTMSNFATQLTTLGEAMGSFATSTAGITAESIGPVVAAITQLAGITPPGDGLFGTDGIDDFGRNLETFGGCLVNFFGAVSGIAPETMGPIIDAVNQLTGITVPDDGFFGTDGIDNFGSDLEKFGTGMAAFLTAIQGLDTSTVSQIVAAARSVAGIVVPEDGLFGMDGIDNFGSDLAKFGVGMAGFLGAIQGLDTSGVSQVVAAARSVAGINIPEDGFFGTDGVDDFGANIADFGASMATFLTYIQGLDTSGVSQVVAAARSVSRIEVPDDGLFGGDGIDNFGTDLEKFGKGMAGFLGAIQGLDTSNVSTVINAAKATGKITVPDDGLFGGDGIDNFGSDLKKFGEGMAGFLGAIQGLDTSGVSQVVAAARSLSKIKIPDDGTWGTEGIDNFGKDIKSFGSSFKSFADNVSGADFSAVSSTVTGIRKIVGVLNSISSADTSGVDSFKKALDTLGDISIDGIVKAFSGAESRIKASGANLINAAVTGMKSRQSNLTKVVSEATKNMAKTVTNAKDSFVKAGSNLIVGLISGITRQRSKLVAAITGMIRSSATSLKLGYTSFYSAGSYLVDGFAAGISAKTWYAEAKAKAMANAAEKAAKEALDINSPSKVFRALGYSVPEGFAMGIDRLSYMAKNSAVGMTDVALNGVKKSVTRIADAMNADMDVAPTIRPLLDLSDIKSGASTIGSLLNAGSSVGVLANVSSINTMMNRRNQNGAESEIVSAINKLRKDVGNMDRNAYSIGNITYDDGSQISETIRTLARAVVREGRV